MDLSEELQTFGRWVLAGIVGLGLLVGLIWALNPDQSGGVTYRAEPQDSPTTAAAPAAEPDPTVTALPTATPTPQVTPTGPDPEELIAAAREPADTSIQVLDAGAGQQRTRRAAEVLDDLGYDVVNVTSARARPGETTVWFTGDNEAEALALRARDDRFAVVEPNQGLSESVDLHVLVAPDW